MELLTDPALWVGLLTLVVLEVVLGIDNLVFIAILVDKLPPHQRDRARVLGLSLALIMRLALLSVVSWLVTLTEPLFSLAGKSFSGRDLILLFGGIFLLYKAVTELHEKIEAPIHDPSTANTTPNAAASFGMIILQIVLLDAVFSLDSVITAVGMVDEILVMMAAVVIAIVIMLIASKPLMSFVNAHPTVVILCLSFLLMIGVSLVADGLGFHIPKGYVYSGIGFAIAIEALNQYAQRNARKQARLKPLRYRAATAIFKMMGGKTDPTTGTDTHDSTEGSAFIPEERYMMTGVLSLAGRDVTTIMVPKEEISWIDLNSDPEQIREQIMAIPHSQIPLCDGELNRVIGVARTAVVLDAIEHHQDLRALAQPNSIMWINDKANVIETMAVLRRARGRLGIVQDAKHQVVGLVTPLDVLEAIAGEFPDMDEQPDMRRISDNQWEVDSDVDLYRIRQELGNPLLLESYQDVADIQSLIAKLQPAPYFVGQVIQVETLELTIEAVQAGLPKIIRISTLTTESN